MKINFAERNPMCEEEMIHFCHMNEADVESLGNRTYSVNSDDKAFVETMYILAQIKMFEII